MKWLLLVVVTMLSLQSAPALAEVEIHFGEGEVVEVDAGTVPELGRHVLVSEHGQSMFGAEGQHSVACFLDLVKERRGARGAERIGNSIGTTDGV